MSDHSPSPTPDAQRASVFISQALPRSEALAIKLEEFVRLLTNTEPWTSKAIPPGATWPWALADKLKDARAGMACLTPENVSNPWIHYEVGALSRSQSDRVWTVLLDLKDTDVKPPLGWRQHTDITDEHRVLKMIRSINEVSGLPKRDDDLKQLFGLLWPRLLQDVEAIRTINPSPPAHRDQSELIEEVLAILRDSSRVTNWRTEKTLRMVEHLYAKILRREPPKLAELSDPARREAIILEILFPELTPYERGIRRADSTPLPHARGIGGVDPVPSNDSSDK